MQFLTLLTAFLLCFYFVRAEIEESDVDPSELPEGMDAGSVPPGMKKFSFKPPKLNEEEQESLFFPPSLKCDGCKAVAFQIFTKFSQLYEKYKPKTGGKAKESDILDAFEAVCNSNNDNYAVKQVNGVLQMVGPGLDTQKDEPGVIQGGGKMPGRMRNLCHEFRGDLGEEELYAEFLKRPADRDVFEDFLCRNQQQSLTSNCVGEKRKDEL